jgi:hypothetical protein
MNPKVLKAFFHKGRKTFVPWMAFELARKTDMTTDEILPSLRGLSQLGYAKARKTGKEVDSKSTWELTALGKAEAMQLLVAEEFIKAGR